MSDADDRRQLQDVMLSYAAAVDARDMARYRACFADDVEIVGFGEATISGADVPRETTVSPIKMLETPRFVAVAAAPDKNLSALQMRAANPTAISSKLTHIWVCPVLFARDVLSCRLEWNCAVTGF